MIQQTLKMRGEERSMVIPHKLREKVLPFYQVPCCQVERLADQAKFTCERESINRLPDRFIVSRSEKLYGGQDGLSPRPSGARASCPQPLQCLIRLAQKERNRVFLMTTILRLTLGIALLAAGCAKPTAGKIGERKDAPEPSEEKTARPVRPSEDQVVARSKSSRKELTAADWIRQLRDNDAARRIQAAEALGKMDFRKTGAITGPARQENAAQEAVAALLGVLSDDRSYVRQSVVQALGRIGPEAKGATLVLIEKSKDPSADVRRETVWALGRIEPESSQVLSALNRC